MNTVMNKTIMIGYLILIEYFIPFYCDIYNIIHDGFIDLAATTVVIVVVVVIVIESVVSIYEPIFTGIEYIRSDSHF